MNKRSLALIILAVCSTIAIAQQEDFNTWYNVSFKGNLYKKVDFSIEPQIRLFDNSRQLSSWQTELNISAPISKWLDVGGAYRYQVEYDDPRMNERVHRLALYTKFGFKINRLRWSYRSQIQKEQANIHSSPDGHIQYWEHRHKISLKYKNKKWFVEPSMGIEYFFCLAPAEDVGEYKNRYFISLEKKVSKRVNASLSFKRQDEFNVAKPDKVNILYFNIEWEPKLLKFRAKKKS